MSTKTPSSWKCYTPKVARRTAYMLKWLKWLKWRKWLKWLQGGAECWQCGQLHPSERHRLYGRAGILWNPGHTFTTWVLTIGTLLPVTYFRGVLHRRIWKLVISPQLSPALKQQQSRRQNLQGLLPGSVSTGQGSHVGANSCHPHLILLPLLVSEFHRGQFYAIIKFTLWHIVEMHLIKFDAPTQGLHAVMHWTYYWKLQFLQYG